ncbi:MAG: hypothetical protein CMP23_16260 [Rickettsiales bacterium]|nr:hypothetical protein [Rickettsiales bacterium]|tara:strand:+ start:112 stop:843 length:732 start_codon:yes stop_codon:yes gene_type:complete
MYSLIVAIAAGFAAYFLTASFWPSNYAILPGIVGMIACYVLLARRYWKVVEALMARAGAEVQQQRVDHAVRILESGYGYGRWVFLLRGQLDGQIGALHYMQKKFDQALPLLEKSSSRHWVAQGMLAAYWFRHHKPEQAMKVLDKARTMNRKEAMLYGLEAWMKVKLKDRDGARAVLARGKKVLPDHGPITENLIRLQNGDDLKMGGFGEAWWQFHLEKPSQKMLMKMAGQGKRAKGARKSVYR